MTSRDSTAQGQSGPVEGRLLAAIDNLMLAAYLLQHGHQPTDWRRKPNGHWWLLFERTVEFDACRRRWHTSDECRLLHTYQDLVSEAKSRGEFVQHNEQENR
jgi:hypothetical protein